MSEREDETVETATKPETAEEKRDRLAEAVWTADGAWYADIENTDLRDAYKTAKAAFREFENAAIARGATESCHRCGGAGGWVGWPGFTCFNCHGHGRESMRKTRFQAAPNTRLKKESKIDAEIAEKDRAFDAAIAELGEVGEALIDARREVAAERDWYSGNYDEPPGGPVSRETQFRDDLATKLWRYGSLSDAQIAAVQKGIDREKAIAAEREAAGPLAEGEYEITGEILTTKWQESQYGETMKMLVKLDNGNKVWGTVPTKLRDAARPTQQDDGSWSEGFELKGSRVAFTAEVERSGDDEHFGFFKRPKGARKI